MSGATQSLFEHAEVAAGLDSEQMEALDSRTRVVDFPAGAVVLPAGSVSPGIHLLVHGSVEIQTRSGSAAGPLVAVASLGEGAVFGELSALAGTPAISHVVATSPVQLAIVDFHTLDVAVREVLSRNVIRINQERLSAANASHVRQLEERLALMARRHSYSRFLIFVIVLFGICLLVNKWVSDRGTIDVYSPAFAWAYLATLVLPTTLMVWREGYPWRVFGFTAPALRRDLLRASAITMVLAALVLGAVAAWGRAGIPKLEAAYLLRYGPLYAAHSALQEFMVRGVLMGMLLQIFGDSTARERQSANVIASLMFALVHVHFGMSAVFVTFVFSLLLGAYYLTSRSLAGVVLIHVVVGLTAFMTGLI